LLAVTAAPLFAESPPTIKRYGKIVDVDVPRNFFVVEVYNQRRIIRWNQPRLKDVNGEYIEGDLDKQMKAKINDKEVLVDLVIDGKRFAVKGLSLVGDKKKK